MGTEYGVICLDCDQTLRVDNGRCDEMQAIAKAGPKLQALQPYVGEAGLEIRHWSDSSFSMEFFREHGGHRLRAVSEYGEVDGDCAERYQCEHGGHFVCALPEGHDGPHEHRVKR